MYLLKIVITILLLTLGLNASSVPIKTIAFIQDDMSNDFRVAQVYDARDEAKKHPNIKFIYSDAKGKVSLLLRNIQKYFDAKVDLMIISTNDADAVVPLITKVYKSNIPVILLDRGINSDNYTTFLTSDNFKIGEIAASFLVKELEGKGEILILEGLLNTDVTKLRTEGFIKGIERYKNIKITKKTGNFLRKDTIIVFEKLIKEGRDFDAIYSESDSMLSGVRTVQKRFNVDPASSITIGVDYISETKNAIRKGEQTATVKFPLGGKEAIRVAIRVLSGEKVSKKIDLPIKLITKENFEKEKPIF